MTILHVVAFKTASAETLGPLTKDLQTLKENCLHPKTGKPYMLDFRGGKQISKEGHEKGMQVVFVMEFETEEDLQYYLDEDPAHVEFKKKAVGQYEAVDVVCLDFSSGNY